MDGYEPHGTIHSGVLTRGTGDHAREYPGAVGGVPGVVRDWVGRWGAIPGTQPGPSQDPNIELFLRLSPTYGQMKGFL